MKYLSLFITCFMFSFLFIACEKESIIKEDPTPAGVYEYFSWVASDNYRSQSGIFPFNGSHYSITESASDVMYTSITPSLRSLEQDFCTTGSGQVRVFAFLVYAKDCGGQGRSCSNWDGRILTTDMDDLKTATGIQNIESVSQLVSCNDFEFSAFTINANNSMGTSLDISVHINGATNCFFEITKNSVPFIPGSDRVQINVTPKWFGRDILGIGSVYGSTAGLSDLKGNFLLECP